LFPHPVEWDLSTALARRPLAVIVANPSALHVPLALEAARAGAHLLIEKPLSHDLDGVQELEDTVAARHLTVLVGFHYRFDPGLLSLKRWLDAGAIGEVVSAQVHWGEYLPDMHPWEDYRLGYAAQAALGGGVLLTLCHPFDYLRWLVGNVEDVSAVESRRNVLGLSVDTCVDVNLRFANGASGHVHLDFVQRPREHRLTIVGSEGTVAWNESDHTSRRYDVRSKRWELVAPPATFERNGIFLNELRHFLACLRGQETSRCTLDDGRAALEVALAAKRDIAGAPWSLQTA
jgi:predicted dehydrogenase